MALVGSQKEEVGQFDTEILDRHDPSDQTERLEQLCDRKSNHSAFFLSEDFDLNCLPQEYKDPDLVECVKELTKLSVLIKVYATSTERPAHLPNQTKPYPFHGRSDESLVRQGSGWVWLASTLWCPPDCTGRTVSGPGYHGQITVMTATHLVFDASEAEHTEVELNVGGETHTLTGGTWKRVWPHWIDPAVREECLLDFFVHDDDLFDKIHAVRFLDTEVSKEELNKRYDRGKEPGGIAIVMSRPHGSRRAKISLGRAEFWTSRSFLEDLESVKRRKEEMEKYRLEEREQEEREEALNCKDTGEKEEEGDGKVFKTKSQYQKQKEKENENRGQNDSEKEDCGEQDEELEQEVRHAHQLCVSMVSCKGCSGAMVWPLGLRDPDNEFPGELALSQMKPGGHLVTSWF